MQTKLKVLYIIKVIINITYIGCDFVSYEFDREEIEKQVKKEKKRQLELWRRTLNLMFFNSEINQIQFNTPSDIVKVLNILLSEDAANHTFLPTGGGQDLKGAKLCYFNNMLIELDFGRKYIINASNLIIHKVGNDSNFWYADLSINKLSPIHSYEGNINASEDCIRLIDGKLLKPDHWYAGNLGYDNQGNEIPIPNNSELITRMLKAGRFVVFSKYSYYNDLDLAYDAFHMKNGAQDFLKYITKIDALTKIKR